MSCLICDSGPGTETRLEFLPSRKAIEVSICEDCLRDVAATTSINVFRTDRD